MKIIMDGKSLDTVFWNVGILKANGKRNFHGTVLYMCTYTCWEIWYFLIWILVPFFHILEFPGDERQEMSAPGNETRKWKANISCLRRILQLIPLVILINQNRNYTMFWKNVGEDFPHLYRKNYCTKIREYLYSNVTVQRWEYLTSGITVQISPYLYGSICKAIWLYKYSHNGTYSNATV